MSANKLSISTSSQSESLDSQPLVWILEWSAYHDLEELFNSVINTQTPDPIHSEVVFDQITLFSLLSKVRNDDQITSDVIATISRVSDKTLMQHFKIQAVLHYLQPDTYDVDEFGNAIDHFFDPDIDEELLVEFTKVHSKLTSKSSSSKQFVSNLLNKYNKKSFSETVMPIIENLRKRAPTPILDIAVQQHMNGKLKLAIEGTRISYNDLAESFTGSDELWQSIYDQTEPNVAEFVKTSQELKLKKRLKSPTESDEENLQTKKQKVSSSDKVQKTVTSLASASEGLKNVGKDPLQSAIESSRTIRRRESETPRKELFVDDDDNTTESAKKNPKKKADILSRKKSSEVRHWESDGLETNDEIDPTAADLQELQRFTQAKSATRQGIRKRWTLAEEELLIRAVAKHGIGKWTEILNNYDFGDRRSVDLKDKWRNLNKPHLKSDTDEKYKKFYQEEHSIRHNSTKKAIKPIASDSEEDYESF